MPFITDCTLTSHQAPYKLSVHIHSIILDLGFAREIFCCDASILSG